MTSTSAWVQRFGRALGFAPASDKGAVPMPHGLGAATEDVIRTPGLGEAVVARGPAVPGAVTATGQAGRGAMPGQGEVGAEFAGMRAMVADDSAINCTILRTFLERLGFEVTLASDGAEAVKLWKPCHYDLLCLDIDMPVMDGLTAMGHMRSDAERVDAPMPMVLAVTINAMTDEVRGYLEAGFDACLPKPFSRNDLIDLLRRRWPIAA